MEGNEDWAGHCPSLFVDEFDSVVLVELTSNPDHFLDLMSLAKSRSSVCTN